MLRSFPASDIWKIKIIGVYLLRRSAIVYVCQEEGVKERMIFMR